MKKNITFAIIFFVIGFLLVAEGKPLERIANELGVEGENFYNEKNYVEAAKKFEEAIAKLDEAVKKDGIPEDKEKISRWYEYAFNGYYQGKDFTNAIRILDKRLEFSPDDYDLIKYKSIIYKKHLEDVDKANEVLIKFDQKKPHYKARKTIAVNFKKYKKNKENALLWYKKAYELKQEKSVLENIALLNKELGNSQEAIEAYEDLIKMKPSEKKLISAYTILGNLYDEKKNVSKATANYEKANALKFDEKLSILLITKYYDSKQYEKATKSIETLLKNKTQSPDAIYYRALINYDKGEKAAAKTDFVKLINDAKYGKSAKGYIKSIKSEGNYESSNIPANTEDDKLNTLYSSGLLKKIKVDINEAWVDPFIWESIDYDIKLGICKTLADKCDKAGSSGRITIIDNKSGDKIAKYSKSFGYKNFKK